MIALGRGRMVRLLLTVAASLALLAPATPVRAATFAFSDLQTSSTFNKGIDFSARLDASEAPRRVELQITFPAATGPFVIDLADPGADGTAYRPTAGSQGLHYTLDTSGSGHIMPNTPISYRWVAYPQGGGEPVRSEATSYRYADETQQWQTLRDGIVTVHWTRRSDAFAQKAAAIAVTAISTDATLLGIHETTPVDFFIYGDDASFRAALGPGVRENVGGEAVTEIRTLFAELTPDVLNDPWVGIVITHELTHQVIDDATSNPYRSLPRWLNEGVAVYQSERDTSRYRGMVQDAAASGDLLPLTALGWQFPTDPQKTLLGYAESVSAVDHVVRTYGKDALVKLILAYKDGPTDDEALTAAIGKNMADFQTEWYRAIGATPPSQFGPQPAPSGPLPSGWTGPAVTQGPAGSPAAAASSSPEAAATATAAPTASPATVPASSAGSGSSTDLALILIALIIVSGAALAGIVIAGRRAASP